jgi:hypothetical protein
MSRKRFAIFLTTLARKEAVSYSKYFFQDTGYHTEQLPPQINQSSILNQIAALLIAVSLFLVDWY